MSTTIDGSTGCSKAQDGSIVQADLAANVVGRGLFASLVRAATQLIPNLGGVFTCNTVTEDATGAYNTSTGRFQPQVAGYYLITASVSASSGSGYLNAYLRKNGGRITYGTSMPIGAVTNSSATMTTVYLNGTTDYIDCFVYHNNGSNLDVPSGDFSAVLVRAA